MRQKLPTLAAGISLIVCAAMVALWVRSYRAVDGFRKPVIVDGSGEFHWYVLRAESIDGRVYVDMDYWHQWGLSPVFTTIPQREWSAIWRQHQLQRLQASTAGQSRQTIATSSTSPWKLEWQTWPAKSSNEWTAKLGAPYWAITITSFGLTTAFWWLRRPSVARFKSGYCTSCGYSLTGNTSGVCPECGTPVADNAGAKR